MGGGTGDGKGSGKGEAVVPGSDINKKGEAVVPTAKSTRREIISVLELLGGSRYRDDGKFYLLDRKEPAISREEIEEAIKKRSDKIELHIYYIRRKRRQTPQRRRTASRPRGEISDSIRRERDVTASLSHLPR